MTTNNSRTKPLNESIRGKPSEPLSFEGIKTYPLKGRRSKVSKESLGRPLREGATFKEFIETLPDILGAKDLKAIVEEIIEARRKGKSVIMAIGAHVIKVGLSPVLIDLMEREIITGVALNGAGIVHDFELAYAGMTSEDVDSELNEGEFGMAEETGRILNQTIRDGIERGLGIGEAVGRMILSSEYPYKDLSILSTGVKLGIPVTVHVAVGTDIIHIHPNADGKAIGEGSLRDFRLFCGMIKDLENGVYINIGSAVVLPEVFLKAITVVRNLGYKVKDFTTVNMDFIQHYRPVTNVVRRPTKKGGRGYTLTGHHEIMVPLLAGMIKESMSENA